MTITRDRIVETALAIIAEGGLAAFSMRRLADDLGVRVNTIYWHVPNKQELLAAVGEAILSEGEAVSGSPAVSAKQEALRFRERMLAVRDGAEIVALARAKRPGLFAPTERIAGALRPALGAGAAAAAEIVAVFVIGATIEEQNRRELERVDAEAAAVGDVDREGLIDRGLDALLAGLRSIG